MIKLFAVVVLATLPVSAHAGLGDGAPSSTVLESVINCSGSLLNIDSGSLGVDCSNNRVGIGITSPATVLDVNGASNFTGTSSFISSQTVLGTGYFAGKVGIGNTAPGSELTVTGTLAQTVTVSCATGIQATSSGALVGCVASDLRLKDNIQPLEYSPLLIDSLKPISYDWKEGTNRDKRHHAGFGAQDVQKTFPRAVVDAGKNTLGIDSNAMIAVLVKEIQNLRKRVAIIEGRK